MLTDIYCIRHAAPDRSQRVPYKQLPGPDLTPHGREEARQAAAFLAGRGLQHLYVSPFARAEQTAEVLLSKLDLPVTFTALIAEHGDRERVEQVRERVGELLHSLLASDMTAVGVVSHGSPIKELLLLLTEGRVQFARTFPDGNPAPTAGIWHAHRAAADEPWQATLAFEPMQMM